MPSVVYEEFEKSLKKEEADARTLFEDAISNWEQRFSWESEAGFPPERIAIRAAHHDLIVMGQHDSDDEHDKNRGLTAQVAIMSGRPVLIVPCKEPVKHIGQRILIAWNGRREVARAVHDAMPFLKAAEAVEIVHFHNRDESAIPCAEIAAHLSRHGVSVNVGVPDVKSRQTGKAILQQASNFAADMIVMGAYGHSRLREMVIGGATRQVLMEAKVPVFLSH